ncbi:hypothetical protein [Lutibaculum baratangense]|uniref:PAS domain-containing protein n=1 Tax=Lutibaculum baratangense AMV1 TaxID=631454 RepID=V4TCV3_9HYPH|nr:hypothetical protein [Lutibaculum baratangense]ESR24133.1 hypothetical protein N177_2582 [Lutibaculum baratangense AMV1]
MTINPTMRLAALVTVTVVGSMSLGGLYLLDEAKRNETAKLESSVRGAWTIGRASAGGSSLDDLVANGRRLTEMTNVTGGVILELGKEVARFGLTSGDTPQEITLRQRLFGEPTHAVHIRDSAHDVTLVANAADRTATLRRAAASVFGLTLLIASLLGGLVAWLGDRWIGRPQRALTDMLLHPSEDAPQKVQAMGRHGQSFDRLAAAAGKSARRVAILSAPALQRAQVLVEHFPHPVLVFGGDGQLLAGNRATMQMFGAADLETLREAQPISALRLSDGTPLADTISGDARIAQATATVGDVEHRGLLAFDRLPDPEEGVDRFVATFVDLAGVEADESRAAPDPRMRRMTATLETCLILIEAMAAGESADRVAPVALGSLVADWRDQSRERDLIGEFIVGSLPIVEGDPTTLQNILASALHVVRGRSSAERPHLMVDSEASTEGVVVTISEAGMAEIGEEDSVAVALAALMKLLARAGGTLVSAGGGAEGNSLAFRLGSSAGDTQVPMSQAA